MIVPNQLTNFLQEKINNLENQILDQQKDLILLSEPSKRAQKAPSDSEQGDSTFSQKESKNSPNFVTLGRIPKKENIEIIKRGFQLQDEGKISLKKYYEGTETDSLFQLKGYRVKYESVRRTKLYKSLKE